MLSEQDCHELRRIADALTRLADYFSPVRKTERKPAHLGTAVYSEEERERRRIGELKGKGTPPEAA